MRALVLLALLAAGPALAAAPSPDASLKKDQGDAKRDAGDATGALADYREALRLSPQYTEAWEEIGRLYFGATKFTEAADAFQRATEIDGSHPEPWFNHGVTARRAGELTRARDAFRRYVQLKPEDVKERIRLADVLGQLGERDAAIREYQAVVDAAEARTVEPALGEKAKAAIAQLRPQAGQPAAAPPATPVAPTAPAQTASAQVQAAPAPAAQPVIPQVVTPVAPPVTAAPPPRPAAEPPAPPTPALLDKLALGDRLHASADYRGALFAYQDAVYLDPRNAGARVKLGRAYWILRYVGQAEEQWTQANALAPNDPSISRQIEEARKAPRPAAVAETPAAGEAAAPQGTAPSQAAPGSAEQGGARRVYKFVPEGAPPGPASPPAASTPGYGMPPAPSQGYPQPQIQQPAPQQYGQPQQYAQPQNPQQYGQPQYAQPQYQQPQYQQPQYQQPAYPPQGYAPPQYPQQPAYAPPVAPAPGAEVQGPLVPAAVGASRARYKAALSLMEQRDYVGAVAELDAAITLDPNFTYAYVARATARFGLQKYRAAAADYKAALDLDPARAGPIWGLAECQRKLKDPAAADTYRRYAASVAGDVNETWRAQARQWSVELSKGTGTGEGERQ